MADETIKFGDQRIVAMLKGRRAIRCIPIPGMDDPDAVLGIRILGDEEVDDCRTAAAQYVQRKARLLKMEAAELLSVDPEYLQREIKRQMVARAFVSPTEVDDKGEPRPWFPAHRAVQQLDSAMVEMFFESYLHHHDYVNPYASLSEAEVQELVDALGKEQGAEAWLSVCDAGTLVSLVLILVKRLRA